ncbi:MAG: tRNA pseudouridine(38-40) synthase TruA [Ruminiclostridium sp.]|nr:tRNA pseudouridine(38-40) synthase TruA [Ruminiclostridium sp.]
MRNLKIKISYNGTAYHGWQRQDNNITVQEVFESSAKKLLGEDVTVHGCSRTDAGVHAREYYLTLRTENPIPCTGFIRGMNGILPDDIAVHGCEDAAEDFHARFSCKGKEYVYVVNTAPVKDVFGSSLALSYRRPVDCGRLDRAAKLFVGTHDFAAFCKAEAKEHLTSTVRTVFRSGVTAEGDRVMFTVSGDGFLHNMVRIMVGTLLYVNEGKRDERDIERSLLSGERSDAGITIPPHGLYLNKVFYDETIYKENV